MSIDDIRVAMAGAFVLFVVILRFDAQRFGAAEYDELDEHGRRPPFPRRLTWYALGIALVAVVSFVHPDPERVLRIGLGQDRAQTLAYGLAFGVLGIAQAAALAWLRWRRLRLPETREYPDATLNAVGTALVDEGAFRGAVLGTLLAFGVPPGIGNLAQTLLYGLASRTGAPGRDRYVFVLTLVMGAAAGWVTLQTAGIGAAVIGHAVTRLAMFATTGHPGMVAPRGHETEEIEAERLPPPGWEVVGEDE